jgi:hypothetical protein
MWPETTYPKTTTPEQGGKVASTFCIAATKSSLVNNVAGLPGPGGLLLPGELTYQMDSTPCPANPSVAACPANPDGGPNQLVLHVVGQSDLDTGWTGISHNQGVVEGSYLCVCLQDCDTTTDPDCTGVGATGAGTINSAVFGAPLPLSTGGAPVCVVNQYSDDITVSSTNMETGTLDILIPLLSKVYQGISQTKPCPTCSGSAIGQSGTCSGGPNNGNACVVDGTSQFGNVSTQCPPSPANSIGDLDIPLDSTTSTSTLTATLSCRFGGGACWCPGQSRMNDCD